VPSLRPETTASPDFRAREGRGRARQRVSTAATSMAPRCRATSSRASPRPWSRTCRPGSHAHSMRRNPIMLIDAIVLNFRVLARLP